MQNTCMPSITVRDVPDETRAELAARAARTGRSMQEYLRLKLVELAATPERDEVLARIVRRKELTGTHLDAEQIISARDLERR
ncbi:MAG: Antitoxin 1 [Marmoricola sp.]|nr:Antitoxin 1 [Marmoricola sp.]